MRSGLLSFAFLSLLSASASAQLAESVSVEVVNVPVYVTRGGAPVAGLTRDDFELYVNGKRQEIEYFDDQTAPEASAGDLRQRRLTLLLFDLAFMDVTAMVRARRAAAQLIANAPATDLFAVAVHSSRRGIWFATPFTRDRQALARGIASLDAPRSGDPLSIVMTDAERSQAYGPEGFGGEAEGELARTALQRAQEDHLAELMDLSDRMAALQGQKHVYLLSQGYDGSNRVDTLRTASLPTPPANPAPGASATDGGGHGLRVFDLMKAMGRAFQAADVFLHTVDLDGVSTLRGNDALFTLADQTGGRFVHNRNDLGVALHELSSSLSKGYVLGFVPRGARDGENRIKVRLRESRRGTEVRHREGFSGTAVRTDSRDGLYLADIVMNDVPQTGTAPVLSLQGNTVRAVIPLPELAAQVRNAGTAELLLYLFSENGTAVGFLRRDIEVLSGVSEPLTIEMPAPAGTHTVKALLRVNRSLGFARTGR